jgi:hypothetical protein
MTHHLKEGARGGTMGSPTPNACIVLKRWTNGS